MTYDPYAELRARPDWTLAFVDMPDAGRWYDRLQTMLVRKGMTQVERRCTVAHEVEHALAGDQDPIDYATGARREETRHRAAARKLITFPDLLRAVLLHRHDVAACADELHVDEDTLTTRIRALHPAERHALRRALEDQGEVA